MKTPRTQRRRSVASYGGLAVIYRDQAAYNGMYVRAVWTDHGIRDIESGYAKRILRFDGDRKERAALAREIAKNRHLHYAIRRNLLDNLAAR